MTRRAFTFLAVRIAPVRVHAQGMRYRYFELPRTWGLYADGELPDELAHEVRAARQRRRGDVDGFTGIAGELTLIGASSDRPKGLR